ncbi:hypothetical protein [Clostridium neonatale]|uniref:hypothetical protein n=1 Tax=Clostridium neonatale TaxID=137838 RepID=UPI001B361CDC|nr:hypothetical protein [Clostridium neonatale]MBP8312303.1 hypothetical protein [Clostridium neonatale]CAI3535533.1 conserved membrane hypothetical protein [Clostridium neonatale]CAI3550700.1 conserved membrane hypothetical protein [Clostridium neonatale]CAI3551137.1 conserved membrane hypothetical protein [Clostridium neonatale]CAI3556768.1 conserved membrane hypothetical protein [Clostridium neonatale]
MGKNKKARMDTNKQIDRNINGRNIYIDKYGRTIYHSILKKKYYVIESKDQSRYYLYHNRIMIIILMLVLLSRYILSVQGLIGVGALLFIVFELWFNLLILPKLEQVEFTSDLIQNRHTLLDAIVKSDSKEKILLKITLYIMFAVLIVVNAYQVGASKAMLIFYVILAILSLYYAGIYAKGLIQKKLAE